MRRFRLRTACATALAAALVMVAGAATADASSFTTVTTQPTDQVVSTGTPASFTAVATVVNVGGVPDWQVSTNGGLTWADDTTDTVSTTNTLDGVNERIDTTTLTVASATSADSGDEYRVQYSAGASTLTPTYTNPATLTVGAAPTPAAPAITTQPAGGQILCPGQTFVWTATASGSPTPSIQWQISTDNGETYTADTTDLGDNTNTLTVPATSSTSDETWYRAVFTNSLGSATSISVVSAPRIAGCPPVILTQPQNTSVSAGEPATFTANATEVPDGIATVQWQVSTDGGLTWTNDTADAGASESFGNGPDGSSTLTIADPMTSQSGNEYRAVYTSSPGGTTTTNAAVLNVTPACTSQPTVTVGDAADTSSAQLEVSDCDTALPTNATVQWQSSGDGGTTWADVAGATTQVYDLPSVTLAQNGTEYRAIVTDANTFGTATSTTGTLYVVAIPSPSNQTALAEQNVTFTSGEPNLPDGNGWIWQVSTDGGNTWNYAQTQPGDLTLSSVTTTESGNEYRAQFNGTPDSVNSAPATLTVLPVPSPASTSVTAGQSATFTASINGGTLPNGFNIQWQVSTNGGTTWSNDTTDSGATTETLTIASTTTAMSATEYRAVITDPSGSVTTSAATLTVTSSSAPQVTGVAPNHGGPFSLVFITGKNFSGATAVNFGPGHPTLFLELTSTLVVALAPVEKHGTTVDVTVTTSNGASATSSADRFTFR